MEAILDWTHLAASRPIGAAISEDGQQTAIKIPRARRLGVRKGGYSLRRATQMSRLGLAGSLLNDVRTGFLLGGMLFAASGAVSYGSSRLQGEPEGRAFKRALDQGLRQGATEFSVYLLAAQAAKSRLGAASLEKSRALLAAFLEPQTAAVWASAAARGQGRTAAGYLSGTLIAGMAVAAVLTAKEAADFLRRRLSKGQALKNIAVLTISGTLEIIGWFVGGVAGAKAGMALYARNPAWGGQIGALAGSVFLGICCGFLGVGGSRKLLDPLVAEDAAALAAVLEEVLEGLAAAAGLSAFERQQVQKRLERAMTLQKFRDMYACPDKRAFAENILGELIAEGQAAARIGDGVFRFFSKVKALFRQSAELLPSFVADSEKCGLP